MPYLHPRRRRYVGSVSVHLPGHELFTGMMLMVPHDLHGIRLRGKPVTRRPHFLQKTTRIPLGRPWPPGLGFFLAMAC